MPQRRTVFIVAIAAGALLALFWPWSGSKIYRNLPPTAPGPWVAFGDSLTEGTGASPGKDYVSELGRSLGVAITNLGRGGDTTDSAMHRLEEVLRLRPRVVLLCLGGNDSLNQVSRDRTFGNLGAIIDRLHEAGAFVVLIGVRSASLRDQNAERFEQLATGKQVFHIPDILQGIAFKPVFMSDAVHPNDEGYARIAARIEKQLRPLLPRLVLSPGE